MAISLHGIRERYLECSVCFQEYNDEEKVPRFLPCNHTYCETCLRTLMRNNGIKCPQCNQEHRVEEITCLPKDNTRRDLRTFLEENKEVPIQYQCCNICPENIPARLYCNTCGLYLCVGCFKKKHKYEGTISHSFTNIHHENFLPDKFTTCERSGHEKGRLKYFGKSQTLSKPGCATCIIEDNSKMLSKKLNYSKDILEQRYAYIDKEKEKLSSIQNSINSEISLIDIFMAELISKASLFQRKVEDLCQSESREMKNKSIMIGNINRAMKNDKRILDVGLRKLKNRQTHVNECFGFLSVIAEIEDALLFYELYTYIMEIVDDMGQTPVEHFDFNTVSSLRECSLTVIEMEKEIKLKDIKSKISTKRKSLKSQVCIGILVWIVMLIFLALLPGRWFRLFEADATFPDIKLKLVSPTFHPRLGIYKNNKMLSFINYGFKSIHGTYGNVYFDDKLSYTFTISLEFEVLSEISKTRKRVDIFQISFSGYNIYEYERRISDHAGIWSLVGFLCHDNSRVCIGTRRSSGSYYENVKDISLSKRNNNNKAKLRFKINPELKEIRIKVNDLYDEWILNNVNFGKRRLRPVFEVNRYDNIKVSIKILSDWLTFDKQYVHPNCRISADIKTLYKKRLGPFTSKNISVKSIDEAMKQSMYSGAIADLTILPDSNIYFAIDIDYDDIPFDESIPMLEIGFLSLSSSKTGNKTFAKSVIGYFCGTNVWHLCFRPNDCLHCKKSSATGRISIHVFHGSVFVYDISSTEPISVFNVKSPAVPFIGLFVPQTNIKLNIISGYNIAFFQVHKNAYYGYNRFLLIFLSFFLCYIIYVFIVNDCLENIKLIRKSDSKTKKKDRGGNKRQVIRLNRQLF